MTEKRIKVEVISTSLPEELKPYALPAIQKLLSAENPFNEYVVYNWHVLFDLGLMDSGVLQLSLKDLAEAHNYVSFDEEMNRTGSY